MRAGFHVVCEKPLVGSLRGCRCAHFRAESAPGTLFPIFQYRFGNGLQKLKFLQARGLTGRAYLSTIETSWRRLAEYYAVPWRGKWATELGGCCLSQAIHAHDILSFVNGPVKSVSARLTTRVNAIEVEDCGAIAIEMADGSVAALAVTLGSAEELSRLRFTFENLTAENRGTEPYKPGKDPWYIKGSNEEADRRIAAALRDFQPSARVVRGPIHAYPCGHRGRGADARHAGRGPCLAGADHGDLSFCGDGDRRDACRSAAIIPSMADGCPSDVGSDRDVSMAEVSLRQVVKRYGANQVVHGVDLDVGHGEFVVFVGPSGCGKSTLLRMIAGLEDINEGELRIDGQRMNEVPPAKREIAMVFQSYALYPHMTVYKNLAFGLETAGFKRSVVEQRVQQAARLLMIEGLLEPQTEGSVGRPAAACCDRTSHRARAEAVLVR